MAVPDSDIEAIRQWAKSQPIVKRVRLFGSRVRGNEKPDSDLDIAIEHGAMQGDSDPFTTAICEMRNWRAQLQPNVSLKIDLQSYIPGQTPTIEAGLRESSVLIYDSMTGTRPNKSMKRTPESFAALSCGGCGTAYCQRYTPIKLKLINTNDSPRLPNRGSKSDH